MTDKKIDALVFDYGGVLVRTVDQRPRQRLERRFELSPGEIFDLVFKSPLWDEVQHGRVDSELFWADVGDRLGLDEGELGHFRRGFWEGDELDEELVDFIRDLRHQGYTTALLSNAPASLRQYVHELGIADAFDAMIISADEGVTKPAPDIYGAVVEALGIRPEDSVFIDDTWINVEAAKTLGFRAVRFQGLAPLRAWLRGIGVRVAEPSLEPIADARAVIFDWGGVMEELPNEADVAAWERRLAVGPGTLPEILWGETWQRLTVGAIGDEEYLTSIAEQLGLPDRAAAQDFLQAFYTSDRLNEEVIASARALRSRYKVAVLSNAFPAQAATIRDHYGFDVHEDFDVYVNSAIVGFSKPDPRIFELTLDRLKLAPSQAIFLDDTLRNVDAARKLGINAIQFVDPGVSLAALEDLLGHPIQ